VNDSFLNDKNPETKECEHKNVKQESGYMVCQDCGLILDDYIAFEESTPSEFYSDSQLDYERKIRVSDSKAKQDPIIKQKYDQLNVLNKWFRDYQSSFTEQKKTIELLKGYGIGLNIDNVRYRDIKDRYLKYNKIHRQTYENMVIIFLAIVWMAIKETTNVRIEEYIKVARELGHKINKKMLNNAMMKVKRTENRIKNNLNKTFIDLEKEIKNKIKILFEKDLNNIAYENVKQHFKSKQEYNKLKLEMQLLVDKILSKISYEQIQNLNYKAFTAGLIYYIGQTLDNRKIFTQSLVERTSRFSSTTIRKKFHILKDLLGDPFEFNL
jgi:transcription initiation factor TFIIIB Brf1 subunit/transcription initiation factor TFIIB